MTRPLVVTPHFRLALQGQPLAIDPADVRYLRALKKRLTK